jgi:hypothetical protein
MDDTQQQQTGSETGQTGQQQAPPAPAAPPATGEETISRAEHQRLMDQLRNEAGQTKKRLKELEDASKSEAERLAEKAARADALEPKITRYEQALKDEIEARKAKLPPELAELVIAEDPAEQLALIRKAEAAAAKLAPAQNTLPPAGGRNPAGGADQVNDKLAMDKAQTTFPALRGRRIVGA